LDKNRIVLSMILAVLSLTLLNAQDANPEAVALEYNMKGDQYMSIQLGLMFPMFYLDMSPDDFDGNYISDTNLSLGASFFLSYSGYINGHWHVGIEAGSMMASSPNENQFYMVPLLIQGAYDLDINSTTSIPISLSAGVNLISYLDNFQVAPMLKPSIGINYRYDSLYTFCFNYNYWFVPEYSQDSQYNVIGNFSEFSLSVKMFLP
jgi:hypothetical protein